MTADFGKIGRTCAMLGAALSLSGCSKPSDAVRKRLEVMKSQHASADEICAALRALAAAYEAERDGRLGEASATAEDRCRAADRSARSQTGRGDDAIDEVDLSLPVDNSR